MTGGKLVVNPPRPEYRVCDARDEGQHTNRGTPGPALSKQEVDIMPLCSKLIGWLAWLILRICLPSRLLVWITDNDRQRTGD